MKVELRVVSEPVKVECACPHCDYDIERQFRDFEAEIGEVCNWKHTKFEYPECLGTIEIDSIDWD